MVIPTTISEIITRGITTSEILATTAKIITEIKAIGIGLITTTMVTPVTKPMIKNEERLL
jgi:hypothetical protein